MPTPTVSTREAVCSVVLNDPSHHNPLNLEVLECLEATIREIADDPDVRVLVLQGSGPSFSAGADLKERTDGSSHGVLEQRRRAGRWQRVLSEIERLPQVSIAALQGHVIGGGVLLAAACDLRIAGTNVRIQVPEVRLGLPLTWGGLPRLVREIGLPRTRDLVITGRSIGAEEAVAWGLVTRLCELTDLESSLDALIGDVLAGSAGPVAMTREALASIGREAFGSSWADADLLLSALRDR
jgi:enoyl-CoA hydratase/carnithine racemase